MRNRNSGSMFKIDYQLGQFDIVLADTSDYMSYQVSLI